FSTGNVRISFLVVNSRGRVIESPKARFWIARAITAAPFRQTVARLESVGVPGVSKDESVKALYVAHLRVPVAGTYYVLACPVGASLVPRGFTSSMSRTTPVTINAGVTTAGASNGI